MSNGDTAPLLKDTIDSQSGRFEFFKQCLTLGAAGLAGVAALFSDPDKIPNGFITKLIVGSVGLSLVLVVAFALFGLSSYANLLRVKTRELANEPISKIYTPKFYENDIISHARKITISLAAASAFLFMFAAKQIFIPDSIEIEDAVSSSLAFLKSNLPDEGAGAKFVKLQTASNMYIVVYNLPKTNSDVAVVISKKDGAVVAYDRNPSLFMINAATGKK